MENCDAALDIGTRLQTGSLTATRSTTFSHSSAVSVIRVGLDARLIAYGDEKGVVTVREVFNTQRRLKLLDAGAAIRDILWHPTDPSIMLVAASNGFVNSLRLHRPSSGDELIKAENNTAVRVKGLIACLGMSPGGTMVAIGFDKSVQITSFPFPVSRDGTWPDGQLLPLEVQLGQRKERDFLTKYHPIPRKIHFLSDTFVCVTFLAGAQCFELRDSGWKHAWSMATPPGSFMGSTAISLSKKVLVASNLTTGLDFYSFATQRFQMSTIANLGFPTKNYTLEAEFVDETTVVTGSNLGQIAVATNGSVEMVTTLGHEQRCPSQSVSAAKTSDNHLVVASACDSIVSIWHVLPYLELAVGAKQEATDEGLKLENEEVPAPLQPTVLPPSPATSQSEEDTELKHLSNREQGLLGHPIILKTKTDSPMRFRSIELLFFLVGPFVLLAYIVGTRRMSSVPDWNTFSIDINNPLSADPNIEASIISASDAMSIGLSTETSSAHEPSTSISSAINSRSTEANVLTRVEPNTLNVEDDSLFGGGVDTVEDTDVDDHITYSDTDMDREPIVITHTIIITRTVTRTVTHKPGRTVFK